MRMILHFSKKALTLLLALTLVFAATSAAKTSAAFVKSDASAAAEQTKDITKNNSDSLARLFKDKTVEYCLFCGKSHSGFGGFFMKIVHNIAYFFCGIFGRFPSDGRMRFTSDTFELGASEPFTFLHMSDTHLTLCDERDDEKKQELSKMRVESFPLAQRMLDDAKIKADELNTFIVHTGDIIDFVSEKNLERVKRFSEENDVFATAGNHEFLNYIFDEEITVEKRDASLNKVQGSFKNNIRFDSRVVNGINIVAIDNGYYRIEQWQLDRLKEEIEKGMPIVLCLHVPLYAPDIYEFTAKVFGRSSWMMSVPEELMSDYPEGEYIEQKEDEITHEAYELIKSSPEIKVILAGHMHYDFVSELTPTLKQYIINIDEGHLVTIK